MASVSTPAASDVVNVTGLNAYILGTTEQAFLAWLGDLITEAEMETAVGVGEDLFDGGTLSPRQAAMLTRAICYRTAAAALVSPELERVTGTHEALVMEDAEQIAAVEQRMKDRAEQLESKVLFALANGPTESSAPYVMPSLSASTFARTSDDRTPSEKNALQDERLDIPAGEILP